jgi:hypothetical protein
VTETTILLTPAELVALTGYRQPAAQLAELHRQGFMRARRSPTTGELIVERTHYLAVSSGQAAPQRPKVRPPKLRPQTVA